MQIEPKFIGPQPTRAAIPQLKLERVWPRSVRSLWGVSNELRS